MLYKIIRSKKKNYQGGVNRNNPSRTGWKNLKEKYNLSENITEKEVWIFLLNDILNKLEDPLYSLNMDEKSKALTYVHYLLDLDIRNYCEIIDLFNKSIQRSSINYDMDILCISKEQKQNYTIIFKDLINTKKIDKILKIERINKEDIKNTLNNAYHNFLNEYPKRLSEEWHLFHLLEEMGKVEENNKSKNLKIAKLPKNIFNEISNKAYKGHFNRKKK